MLSGLSSHPHCTHQQLVAVTAEVDDTVLGFHTADFWLNICVCHSLIVEHKEGSDRPTFQVFLYIHPSLTLPYATLPAIPPSLSQSAF